MTIVLTTGLSGMCNKRTAFCLWCNKATIVKGEFYKGVARKLLSALRDINYLDSFASISFSVFPSLFRQFAGPLMLYPVTKSAAADELEKIISSVVVRPL